MISFSLLRGFLRKEFQQMLRDPRMKILLFVTPTIQLIIFGLAISTEVKNIRLWTNADQNDYVLQHIYQHSIASSWFIPSKIDQNEDPYELLRAGKIDAALIAPPGGLTKALERGVGNLQLLVDSTNVIQAQSVEGYIKSISTPVILEDLNLPPITYPIDFVVRVLYNPDLDTSLFMVPGVLSLLLCISSIVLTSMAITREKEMGTFEMLISAPISGLEIILGKTIPYVVLGMINAPMILTAAIVLFGVPVRGSILVLLLASLMFVAAAVGIGVMISTIARNQQQSMLATFLFLFPAIMLSGLMFPVENMPKALMILGFLDPIYHYLSLVRTILLKGGETLFLAEHIFILFLMAIVFIYISFKRFHTTLG